MALCFVLLGLNLRAAAPSESAGDSPAASSLPGADLFAGGVLHRFRIEIAPREIAALRERPREEVRATVKLGREIYSQVAVHLKGSRGSFRGVDDKPALTLDFGGFARDRTLHGLRKIHLNNSVEDPGYLNEQLAAGVFRAAGVPAPRVAHARVELNGRPLGLYVLKEGFTEDFLRCHFHRIDGNLYEPEEGHDVDAPMQRLSGSAPASDQADRQALASAAAEPDPILRWQRLGTVLEVDRFLTFMALEVMLGHRDGYSLARNNFRLYHDLDRDRMVFLPQGMDQLLGKADLPWEPQMAGIVARAVMETPEGRRQYRERFTALFNTVFLAEPLNRQIDATVRRLKPSLTRPERATLEAEAARVKQRIVQRAAFLKAELEKPAATALAWAKGVARTAGWAALDERSAERMAASDLDGIPTLQIVAGSATSASWRVRVRLDRGRYRFEGRVRTAGVQPLPFGNAHGAALRITGQSRPAEGWTGDTAWRPLGVEFAVASAAEEVELVCELRASAGTVWFDQESLRLVRRE